VTPPTPIQLARRRLFQKTHWERFRSDLTSALGIEPDLLRPIPAEETFARIGRIEGTITAGLSNGTLERTPELPADEIAPRLGRHLLRAPGPDVSVWLCHHPELVFSAPLVSLEPVALALVDFDGDTVYAASPDGTWGFGIDKYTSERSGQIRYTFDCWPMAGASDMGRA